MVLSLEEQSKVFFFFKTDNSQGQVRTKSEYTGMLLTVSANPALLIYREIIITNRNFSSPAATAAKSLQSCPILCDPIDGSPPGCPNPGILQARTLEWVAISFSNAWRWKVKVRSLSRVRLFATPQTVAYQAPPPMGFSRQVYWSGVPLPSPFSSPDTFK